MENFNLINSINIKSQASQKANIVGQNQPQQNQNAQLTNLPSNNTPAQNINPSLMYDFQIAKMDNETILKYLQSLLNLPKNLDKLIQEINSGKNPKLSLLLTENLISVKALNEFLNQNSTQAIQKLLQTISTSLKSGVTDVSQLKEIMTILSAIQTNSSLSSNTLKELLLLYIPFECQVFDKQLNPKELNEEEKSLIKNSKLSILFSTKNYSNLLCAINEFENSLILDICATKSFPKEKFSSIIETLSKEANIASCIDFKEIKEVKEECLEQNFKIYSDGFLASNILIFSHLIIKTVIMIDDEALLSA